MISAAELTRALGGRWHGRYGTARCPCHEDHTPSLSIIDGQHGPVTTCFAGCDRRDIRRRLYRQGLLNSSRARQFTADSLNSRRNDPTNQERARILWQEAISISNTRAAYYLANRKVLTSAVCIDGAVLRFHPSCPFGGQRYECLLALMRDIHTNEPVAIQRTAFTSEGQKLNAGPLVLKLTQQ
jgi:hypothetical protein